MSDFEPVTSAEIALEEHLWRRVKIRDRPDPCAFTGAGPELRIASTKATSDDVQIKSGFSGLPILKTHGSAFEEFTRDNYTTLWEAPDWVLATEITASWLYTTTATDLTRPGKTCAASSLRLLSNTTVTPFSTHCTPWELRCWPNT